MRSRGRPSSPQGRQALRRIRLHKRAGGEKTILLNTHYSLTYPGRSTLGDRRLNLMRGAVRLRVTYRQELSFEGDPLISWEASTQSKSKSEIPPKRAKTNPDAVSPAICGRPRTNNIGKSGTSKSIHVLGRTLNEGVGSHYAQGRFQASSSSLSFRCTSRRVCPRPAWTSFMNSRRSIEVPGVATTLPGLNLLAEPQQIIEA
jgi:hypothetical protein